MRKKAYNAVTLCYNDEATIGATIKCLKPFVKKHIVLLSEKPYFGEKSDPDRSEEICLELGATVIKGVWELDHFQRNVGQRLSMDVDWVFAFDSDELITPEEAESLIKFSENTTYTAIFNKPEVYWYSTDYVLNPRATYEPPIFLKPQVRFNHIRNITRPGATWGGTMHHLSWCKPKDIRKKVLNYAHATDFENAEDWYYNKFETWEYPSVAIMPDNTIYGVKYQPLPQELKSLL